MEDTIQYLLLQEHNIKFYLSLIIGVIIKQGQLPYVAKLFAIIRNMYELQKIEILIEKIAFTCFFIFAFCSLTDRPTDKIFYYKLDAHI